MTSPRLSNIVKSLLGAAERRWPHSNLMARARDLKVAVQGAADSLAAAPHHVVPARTDAVVFACENGAETADLICPPPTRGEVEVETLLTCVSVGTERAVLTGHANKAFPYHPGYSGVGIVARTGKGVSELQPGDYVAGRFKHQRRQVVRTSSLVSVGAIGGEEQLLAAAVIELALIAANGVMVADLGFHARTAVIGQGLVGHLVVRLLRAWSGGEIVAAARTPRRATEALAAGADRFVLAHELDPASCSVVIEASGAPGSVDAAIRATAWGGRVVLLGSHRGPERISREAFTSRFVTLVGAHVSDYERRFNPSGLYSDLASRYLDLVRGGAIAMDSMSRALERPARANEVYLDLAEGRPASTLLLFDWRDR